jgi:hypothetical protein
MLLKMQCNWQGIFFNRFIETEGTSNGIYMTCLQYMGLNYFAHRLQVTFKLQTYCRDGLLTNLPKNSMLSPFHPFNLSKFVSGLPLYIWQLPACYPANIVVCQLHILLKHHPLV